MERARGGANAFPKEPMGAKESRTCSENIAKEGARAHESRRAQMRARDSKSKKKSEKGWNKKVQARVKRGIVREGNTEQEVILPREREQDNT